MYIISKLTTYDSDDQLYYTKIGQNNAEMSLFCIVAGKSIKESKERAEIVLKLLTGNVKEP
jgi:hypothetical protein